MFTPVNMRSANAYRTVSVETAVAGADAHKLIDMLYEALLQSIGAAKLSLQSQDLAAKGKAIGRAVRLIEEGLKASLDSNQGGELAANLRSLYDYCIVRLSEANLHSDAAALDEVATLIRPVADAWKEIRSQALAPASAVAGGR